MTKVPLSELSPKLEAGMHFPFYYASIQCLWVFYETPFIAGEAALARAAEFDTGLEVTRFRTADGGETAGVVLNFQRYTGHDTSYLSTCNEVEFNLLCQPRSAVTTPLLTLGEYMSGGDQTGTVGQLRLHVCADNAFAVKAGRKGFGENKFLTDFVYDAPSLNSMPTVSQWRTTLYRPEQTENGAPKAGEKKKFLYDLTAPVDIATQAVAAIPLTEYALGLGRTVVTRWTLLGMFQTAMFDANSAANVGFTLGPDQPNGATDFVKMRVDLAELINGRRACGMQTFDSPPACIEPPGWFLGA